MFFGTLHTCPPLVKGGQGRTDPDQVEVPCGYLLVLLALAALLTFSYCTGIG